MRRIESTLLGVDFRESRCRGESHTIPFDLAAIRVRESNRLHPEEASLETLHPAEILQELLIRGEEALKQRGEQVPYAVSIREALVIDDYGTRQGSFRSPSPCRPVEESGSFVDDFRGRPGVSCIVAGLGCGKCRRTKKMTRVFSGICLFVLAFAGTRTVGDEVRRRLEYAPAPVDNPLKGLVPYQSDVRDRFPHSMEFNYLPFSALVKGYDEFDWQPLDKLLGDVSGRGNQAVFRVFLEYPGKKEAIPPFLIRDGLKVHKYVANGMTMETPDYQDGNLRRSLKSFLAALGERYDGDPRIGFITAGLLGYWGEWHTYPRTELFAGKDVQLEVMDAYEAAFRVTRVLLRYPVGRDTDSKAANAERRFGYHDDSFAWATIDSGRKGDDWFYMPSLKAAGPAAEAKWKTQPIGGEIRPEAWGQVFDISPQNERIQNFRQCVEETHVTWLMDSGMFRPNQSADRIRRAEDEVRRMGYEFHVPEVTIGTVIDGTSRVRLEVENRGVAPFYYDWKPEYGLFADGKLVKTFAGTGKLTDLLPGGAPRVWNDLLNLSEIRSGRYTLAVRVPNPMPNGKPVRFANAASDTEFGWLSLGDLRVQ